MGTKSARADFNREAGATAAREEMQDRLRSRGIPLYARHGDEEAEDLLDAIERFEMMVESRGGDLLMDRIDSSEPSNPAFVPPIRDPQESIADYRLRIETATDQLRLRRAGGSPP